jgi:hypothetical protein
LDEESYFRGNYKGKGRLVYPSHRQTKEIQTLAASLRIVEKSSKSKPSSSSLKLVDAQIDYYDETNSRDFDLTSKPRILIASGFVNKKEHGSVLRRYSRWFLILCNDLILITSKRESPKEKDAEIATGLQFLQLSWNRFVINIAPESLSNLFASALPLLCISHLFCNRLRIVQQSHCNRFVIALPSLCYRFAITLQSLCYRFAIALLSLCLRFAITLP